jgi:crotonobetainyl-CoA:carnitine CoA-transferase CaiB-like acyl-CoA transferase
MHADESIVSDAARPLAGIVIADLSRVLAGPYATMLLGDLGAHVIKIESPLGDDTRQWMPPVRDDESTYYLGVNRNKHSIALDFADAADRDLLKRIIDRSDVLIENFRTGSLARYGLDYNTLSAADPRLIYASITGFGSAAGADLPGYDLLAQAVSGLMEITGAPDGGPTKVGVAMIDVIAGLHVVVGILASLHERSRSGRGDHLEVNLLSSALSGLVNQTSAVVAAGASPTRMGNAHPSLYPYEPFPTATDDIVIAVGNDGQFRALCAVIGVADLAADPLFASMSARNANRAALRETIVPRLTTRPAADWFSLLRASGVPAAPILTPADGIRFAADLGLAPIALAGDGARQIPTIRHPVSYTRAHIDYRKAPPRHDADRDSVIAWLDHE